MKAIIYSTLMEALRKKTFIVMSMVTLLYLIFWTVLLYHFNDVQMNQDHGTEFNSVASIMLTQTGLQFASLLLCLLTIMLGAGAIASELENGMIHAIISRPLRRFEYVLGKYLGLAVLVLIYTTVLFAAILLIGAIFSLSTVVSLGVGQIIKGWLLYLLVPLAVLCVTIYGSVSLKVVPNGLLMIFVYVLGNIGGMVEMIGSYVNNSGIVSSGIFLSLVSPFHTLFSSCERVLLPATGIAGEMMRSAGGLSGSGSAPSVWMYLYIAVYAVGFMLLAIRKFGKRDLNT